MFSFGEESIQKSPITKPGMTPKANDFTVELTLILRVLTEKMNLSHDLLVRSI